MRSSRTAGSDCAEAQRLRRPPPHDRPGHEGPPRQRQACGGRSSRRGSRIAERRGSQVRSRRWLPGTGRGSGGGSLPRRASPHLHATSWLAKSGLLARPHVSPRGKGLCFWGRKDSGRHSVASWEAHWLELQGAPTSGTESSTSLSRCSSSRSARRSTGSTRPRGLFAEGADTSGSVVLRVRPPAGAPDAGVPQGVRQVGQGLQRFLPEEPVDVEPGLSQARHDAGAPR